MRNDLTHIVLVLDRSGSMSHIVDDTIGGVNKFFEEQAQGDGEATGTVIIFDNPGEDKVIFENRPVDQISINKENYVPRGMTALYDAVGTAIVDTGRYLAGLPEEKRPGNVIFVMMTDGMENSSKTYNAALVQEKIQHQECKYSWRFVYLGANQDAILAAKQFGVHASMAMTYDTKNLSVATKSVGENIRRYRTSRAAGASAAEAAPVMCFSAEQRTEAVEED